ncbi:Vacuolar protein sorting-associate protein Vta1/Callose synthase, N-terminal domain [Cinara cedri]|uniref:Vacuolar protein sorting-associate protein Vta1/Callose synthase, N-terminal domain n=1 Tax=Cinara cedri TaxID=506608 RepID=A0A5E4MA06_9HEMI|nr:Vacuolar protein sorting-associate protein Vta1/Callose synthase, N-terminal domain [Cinara cedri]
MAQLPECPETLKKIQHYLKIASEHDAKDPIISYWCRLYALQTALTLDKSSKEAKTFLVSLMDWLEKQKVFLKENDMITNETAAQAHFENYAIKLFNIADGLDHQANYNKNIIKLFFTAGLLMDVLSVFGEVSEEIANTQKYAKWKATYIHNCLKNGETPTPGPPATESGQIGFNFPTQRDEVQQPKNYFDPPVPITPIYKDLSPTMPNEYAQIPSTSTVTEFQPSVPGPILLKNGVQLLPAHITKAQKYCKFAASALNYDDVPESIANLQKALRLLTTGEDV